MALFSLLYMGKLLFFVWVAPNTSIWPVLNFSSAAGGPYVWGSGRLAAQLIAYLPYILYTIYTFDSSIDSATQGLLNSSAWLLAGTNFLYIETPNMWRREHLVFFFVKRIRFKPLDPFF
jgi:hypothetical protein